MPTFPRRPHRPRTAVAALAGIALVATSCGSPMGLPAGPGGISPGHATPEAAVAGFLQGLAGPEAQAGCAYVLQAESSGCNSEFRGDKITFSGLGFGNSAAYKGELALVVVTGNVCVRLASHPSSAPLCFTNTDKSQGLPKSDESFSAAFTASPNILVGTIACERANGQWFVTLRHQMPSQSG